MIDLTDEIEKFTGRIQIGSVLHDCALDRWIFILDRHAFKSAWAGVWINENNVIKATYVLDDELKYRAFGSFDLVDPPSSPEMMNMYANTIMSRSEGYKALLMQVIDYAKSQVYYNPKK